MNKRNILYKKYLIIKFGELGDVVMALSLVEQLLKDNLHVDFITYKGYEHFLKYYYPKLNVITFPVSSIYKLNLVCKIYYTLSVWKKIALRRYHTIFILYGNKKYRILTIFSFSKYIKYFKKEKNSRCYIGCRHLESETLRLNGEIDNYRLKYGIYKNNRINQHVKKSVVLCPGGASSGGKLGKLRVWPIEYYYQLAKLLISSGYKVILLGDSNDKDRARYFLDLNVIDYIGKTNINQVIDIMTYAEYVVTHDSGLMHLASFAGSCVIGLFGPTNPYEKISKKNSDTFFWGGAKLACRPCYDGHTYAICDNNVCMKMIKPFMVFTRLVTNSDINYIYRFRRSVDIKIY